MQNYANLHDCLFTSQHLFQHNWDNSDAELKKKKIQCRPGSTPTFFYRVLDSASMKAESLLSFAPAVFYCRSLETDPAHFLQPHWGLLILTAVRRPGGFFVPSDSPCHSKRAATVAGRTNES